MAINFCIQSDFMFDNRLKLYNNTNIIATKNLWAIIRPPIIRCVYLYMEMDGFVRSSYNCNQNMCSLHSNTYAWHFVSINMPSSLTIGCSGQSRKLKSTLKSLSLTTIFPPFRCNAHCTPRQER